MQVSVVIPCFNVAEYIEECLHSVYAQEYGSIEVICVDNNSTDSTPAIINKLKKEKFPDLNILSEPKKGANAARNKGLAFASGEWIQFLDADDLLEPKKISTQVNLIRQTGFSGFIAAKAIRIKINGEQIQTGLLENNDPVAVFTGMAGNTCSNLWEKKWLKKINGWNENLQSSQEADLMLRLVAAGCPILFETTTRTLIRDRATGQISQSDPSRRWIQLIDTRINFLHSFQLQQPEEFRKQQNTLFTYLLSSLLILAKYNRKKAVELYNSLDFKNRTPEIGFGISKINLFLLKLLGFPLITKLNSIRQKN
jgi:glycosyltransferase involved in cell wall biosynthesis